VCQPAQHRLESVYVMVFVMNIETNFERYPGSDLYKKSLDEIHKQSDAARKGMWNQLIENGSYDGASDEFMFPGEDLDAVDVPESPGNAWRNDYTETVFDDDAHNDYDSDSSQ
jgi:hypothetical protein